jgi:hypothetical protein
MTMRSIGGYQRAKAKVDNFLERLSWEPPMNAEQRKEWKKIRAGGFSRFMIRRLLFSVVLGMVG